MNVWKALPSEIARIHHVADKVVHTEIVNLEKFERPIYPY